jgi:hypothetical protein
MFIVKSVYKKCHVDKQGYISGSEGLAALAAKYGGRDLINMRWKGAPDGGGI